MKTPGIPGVQRGLFGQPAGSLFDVAEETKAERAALKRRRRSEPPTVTESPADYHETQPESLPGQNDLF